MIHFLTVAECSRIHVILCFREEQHDRTDMDATNCPLGAISTPFTRTDIYSSFRNNKYNYLPSEFVIIDTLTHYHYCDLLSELALASVFGSINLFECIHCVVSHSNITDNYCTHLQPRAHACMNECICKSLVTLNHAYTNIAYTTQGLVQLFH